MVAFEDNEGITYSCAEQYMMAKKASLFDDAEIQELIMNANHPRDMQRLGREVRGFDRITWNANAIQIVYQANMYKFLQNNQLLENLVSTRGTVLVEASPYDTIWGIGLDENDPLALNKATWRGLNWLGYTLTSLRDNYFRV